MKKLGLISFTLMVAICTFGLVATSVSAAGHEVEKGDTLWDIANTYHTTVEKLKETNHLKSTVIHPKQTLHVEQEESDTNYMVEKGDTLSEIAKEFDISVKDIKEQNDLSSDLIVIGQELKIGTAGKEQKATSESEQVSVKEENEVATSEQTHENVDASTETSEQGESPSGKTFSVSATAYTAYCDGCSGKTATGVDLIKHPDEKVIAVDPNVIPLGTKVYVEGYGYATAEDTGGAIKGNRIDVYIPSEDKALDWGLQSVDITIIDE